MKKTSDNTKGIRAAAQRRRPCLMAYTLNNSQPVICTILSDQPYFYMEEESLAEDDDILGFEEYADLENDLAELRRKMEAYEHTSKAYERDPGRRLEEFTAQAICITEEKKTASASSKGAALILPADRINMLLNHSRMGKALLEFAHLNNVFIVESDQVSGARYDREAGKILVHSSLGEMEQCLLAVRELRRHWQHRKGALIHPLTFYPDQAILVNRAQIADLTIAMIRCAWELQLAGKREAWEFIEQSAMSDLGRAFAREALVDFRSIASGKASSAVFESWFLSERCRHQDKKLIQAMLADHQGYVFTSEEASRSVSIEMVMSLGEQPFGKNYLAPYAQMIIEDPVFTEVRDRSNANFLWFIKFERSFRETEQALQSEEGTDVDGLSASPHHSKAGSGAKASSNGSDPIIISLSSRGVIHRGERDLQGANLEDDEARANVIHVRFGNADSA